MTLLKNITAIPGLSPDDEQLCIEGFIARTKGAIVTLVNASQFVNETSTPLDQLSCTTDDPCPSCRAEALLLAPRKELADLIRKLR